MSSLFFSWIVSAISASGYAGVVGLMALELACFPLPSEVIMPFAGYLASTGRFSMIGAGVAAPSVALSGPPRPISSALTAVEPRSSVGAVMCCSIGRNSTASTGSSPAAEAHRCSSHACCLSCAPSFPSPRESPAWRSRDSRSTASSDLSRGAWLSPISVSGSAGRGTRIPLCKAFFSASTGSSSDCSRRLKDPPLQSTGSSPLRPDAASTPVWTSNQ